MTDSVNERLQEWANSAAELFGQQLISILVAQNSEISRLRDELSRLQDQVTELTQRSMVVDESLGLRQDYSAEDPALGSDRPAHAKGTQVLALTENEYIHHRLAERYHRIVDQRLAELAEGLIPQSVDSEQRSFQEAELVARLCHALFSGLDFDSACLTEEFGALPNEMTRLCDEVSSLRDDIAKAGEQLWRFEFETGKLPDPEWQETWPGCPADAPIIFVVAPAYVAHDRVFSHQQVFTSQKNEPKRPWTKRLSKAKHASDG